MIREPQDRDVARNEARIDRFIRSRIPDDSDPARKTAWVDGLARIDSYRRALERGDWANVDDAMDTAMEAIRRARTFPRGQA